MTLVCAARTSKQRILIVEDEPFVALSLMDTLYDLGFAIAGCVTSVPDALELIGRESIDGALLDVKLGAQSIDPVADLLARRACPFIFTTGYGRSGVPLAYADHTVLEKPFGTADLVSAMRLEFGAGDG